MSSLFRKEKQAWLLWQLQNFITELHHLLSSGLSLFSALTLLNQHLSQADEVILAKQLQQKIARGLSFSLAWQQTTAELLSSALLVAGEHSGLLVEMLAHIKNYAEAQNKFRQLIWQAIRYPIFLAVLTCGLLGLLCSWVVPQFASLYQNFNVQMPQITQVILSICGMLQHHLIHLGSALFFLMVSLIVFRKNTWVKRRVNAIKHRFVLYRQIQELRFWHTVSLLLQAGIPLSQALKICQQILDDEKIKQYIIRLVQQLHQGLKPSVILKQFNYFSPKLISILALGEESGQLAMVLSAYVAQQTERMHQQIQMMKTWLEPIFLCCIGSMIGVVLIALYLPIVELGKWV
jgi:type II secretory pathway component PulF